MTRTAPYQTSERFKLTESLVTVHRQEAQSALLNDRVSAPRDDPLRCVVHVLDGPQPGANDFEARGTMVAYL